MTRRLSIVAIAIALGCLAGCDTFHGVSRALPLNTVPSAEAVEQCLRVTPRIAEVKRNDILPEDSGSLFAQFACWDAKSAFAVVESKETNKSGKQLQVYCIWMNHVPTKSQLSDARALIDRICVSLHRHVAAIPASSASDDEFVGIKGF